MKYAIVRFTYMIGGRTCVLLVNEAHLGRLIQAETNNEVCIHRIWID